MISRFFLPRLLASLDEVELSDRVAHHAVRVLRLRDGDPVVLFDGSGGEVRARLRLRDRKWFARLEGHSDASRESPLECVLVQALASGDKMDWVVQKAVELGVSTVMPVRAERSVVRLSGARAARREAHWRQVILAACEQSGRNRIPELAQIADLKDYLRQSGEVTQRWYFDPACNPPLSRLPRPGGAVHVLVGPEAGWSDSELAALSRAGCRPVGLGPRVLRTETAGLAALAAMQALWGDF